jgi:peptidoglycan-N-acetylglucosamine deacetylase
MRTVPSAKPIASLSLDVDNKWAYQKTHGDPDWESFPSYLDTLVPRVLDFLAQRSLTITFFIVGQDAVLERNRTALQAIAAAGHEIGNHSFSHEPWLSQYSREEVEREIVLAEEHITRIAGQRPVGFRGPGYSLSQAALEVLKDRGYLYDASTLPTFVGPLARSYYFFHSQLRGEELKRRQSLFGSIRDGFRPMKPYRWRQSNGLLEMPLTTMPIIRIPIHMSYLLYLASFSRSLAANYFQFALKLCRLCEISPSLLLHPLDFLGRDDRIGLEFFPAMSLTSEQKLHSVSDLLSMYSKQFRVVTLKEHARHVIEHCPTNVVGYYLTESALWVDE